MAMNIMIQGTMSNAGKSLLAAGLCRVLKQDGYRVAPFKSQNMALNSFITKDGGEMGRAQVVQAEAAGIEPDTRMNPILLKPTTDVGSQVIVNGQVRGNMQAMEYFHRKRDYIPAVLEAYNSLNSEYDVIVIEGAGSPAEINLKQDDIVNMGLAKLVDAPVLLVGDIDRGGVFAQLYGTVALLEEDERRRIKGVVVNKFRGDRAILEPGLKTLEQLCGIPVAGVIPYAHVDIDDEDSLTERFDRSKERKLLDIAVIRVPRISNFTDFSPFEHYGNVSLRYVDQMSDHRKRDYIPAVLEAYNSLNSEYDVIVIEGAGSPAEINLKQDDIVNMGLAKLVDAPVLLVGDIDRGGVFAQLYGTVALLEEDERRRIKGVVVNKFRGDRAILEPGLKTLEQLCGIPVAGVIPYAHVDIDDEDSLTERFDRSKERKLLDIAVIRVPRISNFTDFSPFEHYRNVSLRYVDQMSDLHQPDMILLPGTKSTIADLRWLRQSGLEAAILKAADAGTLVFGICGGYQMLGRTVSDPEHVEAAGVTEINGLGLLEMDTEFRGEKVQTQTRGVFYGVEGMLSGLNGLAYKGYEIHMGRSQQQMPALTGSRNIYGSYVHGIFDAPGITDTILKALCARKGVSFDALATFDACGYKERQYDLLADVVRGGLDMSFVYRVLRREV